ncbi:MAG: aminotransferase class I/II-fold pyridoxal phosphate-dependent enzyme, partial [Ketobacter sp.]
DIPGISCVKPKGALYLFPRLDPKVYPIVDDQKLVLDLLIQEKILLVQGSGFNWPAPDHLRLVFLPREEDLKTALTKMAEFFERLRDDMKS